MLPAGPCSRREMGCPRSDTKSTLVISGGDLKKKSASPHGQVSRELALDPPPQHPLGTEHGAYVFSPQKRMKPYQSKSESKEWSSQVD